MSYLAPAWATVPDWHTTLGPEVADLCASAGYVPDEGQRQILDASFAIDKNGLPVAFEIGVIAPRQNIKTGVEKMIALGWMFVLERNLCIWSAHETNTSKEAYADLSALIEGSDFLRRQVLKMNGAEGREYIRTRHGRLLFKTRTGSGGRGLSGDDTILDEAFALKSAHMGALLPVMLTRPHAQVVYGSSAGLAGSDILRALRDRGRVGSDRLAYFEWGDTLPGEGCERDDCDHATTTPGCVLDDPRRWWATNPALGVRIDEESIANLRRSLPPEEFARECLGWWDERAAGARAITVDEWIPLGNAALDVRSSAGLVLTLDVAPHHASASIVAVGMVGSIAGIELADKRPGSSWAVPRVAELIERYGGSLALNSSGPVGSLIPELERAGLTWTDVRGSDYVKACEHLASTVRERALQYVDDDRFGPAWISAIAGVETRKNGDGFTWSRADSSTDITPLVGASVGLWAATAGRAPLSDSELLESFH